MRKHIALLFLLGLWAIARTHADTRIVGWGAQSAPPDPRNVVQVAAGDNHSIAKLADGTAIGWGSNSDGRANPFTAADLAASVHPYTGIVATSVKEVRAGRLHSAFWLDNGMVVTRGSNSLGQVGVFPFTTGNSDPAGLTIVDVACGANFTAVAYLRPTGGVYSIKVWGQIKSGDPTGHRIIQPVTEIPVGNPVWTTTQPISRLAGGSSHLLWIFNGIVTGVGNFTAIGSTNNTGGAVRIAAGNAHSVWLNTNGDAYGKGTTMSGFLSGGHTDVAMGLGHIFFRDTGGTVSGYAYQLPEGNQGGQGTPPALLTGVIAGQISAGGYHSLAVVSRKELPPVSFTLVNSTTGRLNWPLSYPEYTKVLGATDAGGPYTELSITRQVVGGQYQVDVPVTSNNFFKVSTPGGF